MKNLILIAFILLLSSCYSQKIEEKEENYQIKEISDLEFHELFDSSLIQNQLSEFENGLLIYEIKNDFSNGNAITYNFKNGLLEINCNNFERNIKKDNIDKVINAKKYFKDLDPNSKSKSYVFQHFKKINHSFINIYILKKNNIIIFKAYSLNGGYKNIDNLDNNINKLMKVINSFRYK